jgi:hypothetical protein
VSKADVDNAMAALGSQLAAQLSEKLAAETAVPSGVTVFPETQAVGDPTPTIDPDSLVGTDQTQFELGATATGTVLTVDSAPIQALAEARIRAGTTAGWSVQPGSVHVQVGSASVVGGVIEYPVAVSATRVRDVDVDALRAQIRGLGLPQARSVLSDYGDVTISLWPDWVTTIPTSADKVTLTLGDPAPAATSSP